MTDKSSTSGIPSRPRVRFRIGLAVLGLLPLVVVEGFAAKALGQGGRKNTIDDLMLSPYTYIAIATYGAYFVFAPWPSANISRGKMLIGAAYWIGAGFVLFNVALLADLFDGRWYEVFYEVPALVAAGASFADGVRRIARALPVRRVKLV